MAADDKLACEQLSTKMEIFHKFILHFTQAFLYFQVQGIHLESISGLI